MRILLLLTGWLTLSCAIRAQIAPITGKVVDARSGVPLAGATVKVRSSKTGRPPATSTNNDGDFSIRATPEDILEISFIGYSTQSFPLHGQTHITAALTPHRPSSPRSSSSAAAAREEPGQKHPFP